MNVLVIGGGGREHAVAWKLSRSPRIKRIFCAPGNAGIVDVASCVSIAADDVEGLLSFAEKEGIDLTVVGPEAPLTKGIVDVFRRNGLKIFGPTREAASLEGSKVFTKEFCLRHNIPTARSAVFTNINDARTYLSDHPMPVVVKADGLAAGKGVIICRDAAEASKALKEILVDKVFGDAGKKVVIEEFLQGEEASFIAISDGSNVLPLATSQDHKRAFDGDQGSNTGGMGAYSPAPVVTASVHRRVMEKIILPTIRGMASEGRQFTGVLYAGLMIRNEEPMLLEFNCRFGDPETQPIMMRLKTDLVGVIEAAIDGTLDKIYLEWDDRPAVCVIMASGGYPGSYEKGKVIRGLPEARSLPDVTIFHAGTSLREGDCVTSGGRVLGVTALGDDVAAAIKNAYAAVEKITWENVHYRKDIGKKALAKSQIANSKLQTNHK